MTDWYDCIEPGIRPMVKLLRDNGFNTTCSCEHEMYIEGRMSTDGELQRLDNLLFNNGFRNYFIIFEVRRIEGHSYSSIRVEFNTGTPKSMGD